MKKNNKKRSKWLTIRLSDAEEKILNKFYDKTTARNLSEYARNVLLQEPVTILYRNQSADQFLNEMLVLKQQLQAIGKNFNQAVHKLHTLDYITEIKEWALLNENSKAVFMKKVEEIQQILNTIYYQWLQK